MHFATDLSTALQNIEAVKAVIDASDDAKLQLNTADNLKLIIGLLQDPVLRSIVQVQDSLSDLNKQIVQHPSMLPSDFDISLAGDLVLNVPNSPTDIYDADYQADEQRVPSAQLSPHSSSSPPSHQYSAVASGLQAVASKPLTSDDAMLLQRKIHTDTLDHADSASEAVDAMQLNASTKQLQQLQLQQQSDLMAAEWALIQSLELVNDGTGLGFGIIGARTAGVIVKTIMPGGVADRDGRLLSGDHILRIGDVDLHDMVSEQVASVLRQSGTHVRLVVARSIDAIHGAAAETDGCIVVPGRLLSQPRELDRYMVAAGYADMMPPSPAAGALPSSSPPRLSPMLPAASPSLQSIVHHAEDFSFHEVVPPSNAATANSPVSSIANRPMLLPPHELLELPETDRFIVELTKDANGLGITIAGYVCEKEELSGIFVKSVSPGSAADLSGRIQVNDRIIEVDQQPLQGYSNHQAVEVLKKSGSVVRLCLERYLRGPKFEQLQQAIAANETTASVAAGAGVKQATLPRPPSGQSMYKDGSGAGTPSQIRRHDHDHMSATAGSSARKLLTNARDSLETRNGAADEFGEEPVSPTHAVILPPVALVAPLSPPPPLPTSSSPTAAPVQAINLLTQRHKYWVEPVLSAELEDSIRQHWRAIMPADTRIIVAQIRKFAASSGLGISLEGTVDVEGGMEVRPHHYIRSILPEGPVGQNGLLRSSDELLGKRMAIGEIRYIFIVCVCFVGYAEVNKQRLLGMNHVEVVSILKELPQDVRMVCARSRNPADQMVPFTEETLRKGIASGGNFGGSQNLAEKMAAASERLVKAKSDGSLATSGGSADDSFSKLKSR